MQAAWYAGRFSCFHLLLPCTDINQQLGVVVASSVPSPKSSALDIAWPNHTCNFALWLHQFRNFVSTARLSTGRRRGVGTDTGLGVLDVY